MSDEQLKVVKAMEKYGGSFVQALAVCFYRADQDNFHKLKQTFSEYWSKYEKVAEEVGDEDY